MNRKQKIIISVTGIFVVLLILVGLTYAYFLTQINGNTNTKSVSVSTKKLQLVYTDGNGIIAPSGAIGPGDTISTKTFSVTNSGDETTDYAVVVENINITNTTTGASTTFDSNDFVYTLTCTSSSGSCTSVTTQTQFPLKDGILVTHNIGVGVTQTYSFTLTYLNTEENQASDMNKTLEAKINIRDVRENPYTNTSTLAYNIVKNSVLEANGTKLVAVPATKPAVAANSTTEKELSVANDDDGISYYYRGNVEDNYVNFSGKCWRVVRIQGDGSIKLILEDKDTVCNNASYTGNWVVGTGYYGYIKGKVSNTSGSVSSNDKYVANFLNEETPSYMSSVTRYEDGAYTQITNWINDTNNGIDKSKLKSETWCLGNWTDTYNNSGTKLTDSVQNLMYNGTTFYYETYKRLYGFGETANATYRCNGSNDKTYEGYVGLITADEAVFAGGKAGTANYNYYLLNNYARANSKGFRTLTPARFSSTYAFAFYVNNTGNVLSTSNVARADATFSGVRPAVSLKSSTEIMSGGVGTKDAPYVIK